jgi:hypothetical protein
MLSNLSVEPTPSAVGILIVEILVRAVLIFCAKRTRSQLELEIVNSENTLTMAHSVTEQEEERQNSVVWSYVIYEGL